MNPLAKYVTTSMYGNGNSDRTEHELPLHIAERWLKNACAIFRSVGGFNVKQSHDNRSAVITNKDGDYMLEIEIKI